MIFKKDFSNVNIDKLKYRFFVFDTETTALEPMSKNFVFGVIYGFRFKKVIYSVEEFKEEFKDPRYKGKYIFAHNAEFDLMTLYGNIYQNLDRSAVFNGGFIMAQRGGVMFADSMNIFPRMSVKKIGQMIGLEKLDNLKVRSEGLTRDNITPQDIEYCTRDCQIIFKALLQIFKNIGNIKVTLSSLAMWDYRHNYLKESFIFPDLVYDFFGSYFGGRCEAFKVGTVNARVFDINSMYPYAMKYILFPDPRHLKRIEAPGVNLLIRLLRHYEGMAKIKVRHKKTFFGYLPCKIKIGSFEKLIFPIGEFETTVNFNELRFALYSGVIEILSCDFIVYGLPVESPFTDYVNDIYRKKEMAKDLMSRTIYKLRLNSLYGKFGQTLKYKSTYYETFPIDEVLKLTAEKKYFDIKPFSTSRDDCFLITEIPKSKNGFYSVPLYSSYITSEARIYLLKHFIMNDPTKLVYSDTDSIFIEGELTGVMGTELGEFKEENKNVIQVNGLKNYVYINEKNEKIQVLKGVEIGSQQTFYDTNPNENPTYSIKKYYKTLQSLRQSRPAGESFTMTKSLRHKYDKRIVLETGETLPVEILI
jgi:hypothetical protein